MAITDSLQINEDEVHGNDTVEMEITDSLKINGDEEPKEGMLFDTHDEAFNYYAQYAKKRGFAVARMNSRKDKHGVLRHVTFACTHGGQTRSKVKNSARPRPQTKTGCETRLNLSRQLDEKWRLNNAFLEHNHVVSPGKYKFYKSNRVLDARAKRQLLLNDLAGIKWSKTYESMQLQAGGHENLPFVESDLRNFMNKWRRSIQLAEGDAEAMQRYFKKMKTDNSEFYSDIEVDDNHRLLNVFWADARSRAAFKEFGDVVTFDTTYVTNKYGFPFACFVGVNHHGQSVLLGCGLIAHEDTNSFVWLFKTWMVHMKIQEVFPNTRHRWCIWHIMKKVPEKFGKYGAYQSISPSFRNLVFGSLTVEEFEIGWEVFIKEYNLEENEWLKVLYMERRRWVPVFLNDIFWAGMQSTQRSESMNHYFKGYINDRTTLKQFVEQYENALAGKVNIENSEDKRCSQSYIPTIVGVELEKQFHRVYTHAKIDEFREEFLGKLACECAVKTSSNVLTEYEVVDLVTYGEEKRTKRVSFLVNYNNDTNEASCVCRLFEYRGMVCRHQLMAWQERRVQMIPEKYVLRRWRKDVKRIHTKVRINYANSSRPMEAIRHDKIYNRADEVAYLAENSEENYLEVMELLDMLKKKYSGSSIATGSGGVTRDGLCSFGDGDIPSVKDTNILDPEPLRRRGKPPTKRLEGVVDKIHRKKMKKTSTQNKSKVVSNSVLHDKNDQVFETQESCPIYSEPHMFEFF